MKVHIRGKYDRLGDLVPRRFPLILAGENQAAITVGSGRLELGRWLGTTTNPLTARVIMNRLWQHHFGEGIVRTPSNFGFLGDRPSHPELLDWLASTFMAGESAWSLKRMHKLILMSNTFQQSAKASVKALRYDADNRLFSRMSRRRLEAEAIRDSILSVSGRLESNRACVVAKGYP